MLKRHALSAMTMLALFAASAAIAAEKTVTLTVDNMTCASCPFIVKKTLTKVEGVSGVKVSFEDKTAVVTYDDALADVGKLTAATTEMGFPSQLVQ